MFKPIPAYSNLFQHIQTYSSIFKHIQAYISLFEPIQAYSSPDLLKRSDTRMHVRAKFSRICAFFFTFQCGTCKIGTFSYFHTILQSLKKYKFDPRKFRGTAYPPPQYSFRIFGHCRSFGSWIISNGYGKHILQLSTKEAQQLAKIVWH